jgi:hypothetical protein
MIQDTFVMHSSCSCMKFRQNWKPVYKTVNELGIEKETLFKYRDDGTLKLGPHFRAFSDTYSRDSYRWNVDAVRTHLQNKGLLAA